MLKIKAQGTKFHCRTSAMGRSTQGSHITYYSLLLFIAYNLRPSACVCRPSENCKSLVLQGTCNIEIFVSPEASRKFLNLQYNVPSIQTLYLGLDKQNQQKIVNIFLAISISICFGCSKAPSHGDGSFEYTQHMFWLRNKKINYLVRTLK